MVKKSKATTGNKKESEEDLDNDVILTDEDSIDWEGTDEYYKPLFKFKSLDEFRVDPKEKPYSVHEILRHHENDKIIIDPEFQRNPVWTKSQQSCFIESILLDIPLPALFFNVSKNGNLITIDGLQRIVSLINFKSGELKLTGLKVLGFLNGKRIDQMPPKYVNYIEDKIIYCHLIRSGTPPLLIYDFFARLNTKGTQLNRMEVRNCLHFGKGSQFLKEIARSNNFYIACSGGISDTRMKAREAILRYFSFRFLGLDEYNDNEGIDNYLNKGLQELNSFTETELRTEKKEFYRLLDLSFKVFGDVNFRSFREDGARGRINFCLFETVLDFLSENSERKIISAKTKIKKSYINLLTNDDSFIESIQRRSYLKENVLLRFEKVEDTLGRNL